MQVLQFFALADPNKSSSKLSHLILLVLFGFLIKLALFPYPVFAQSVLTVDPAFQEVNISENQTEVSASISFTNEGSEVIELELFAYDFTQTDVLGSVGLLPANLNYPHTLASFLEFEQNKLVLDAGERQTVTVLIRNRTSLTPGGHYAAVVARLVQEPNQSAAHEVVPAVSALLLVRKTGGEQYHVSLSDISWKPGPVIFSLPERIDLLVRNDGNIHDIPRGLIHVHGLGDTERFVGTINQSSLYVLPGTQRKIPVSLESRAGWLPIDFITVTVAGYGQYSQIPFSHQETAILLQWQGFVAFAVIFLVGTAIWWRFRRKRGKP